MNVLYTLGAAAMHPEGGGPGAAGGEPPAPATTANDGEDGEAGGAEGGVRVEIVGSRVTPLITHLLSMRGKKLWAYEDASVGVHTPASSVALGSLVGAVVAALGFEPKLQDMWAQHALKWVLDCRSRHLSCRSLQVRGFCGDLAPSGCFLGCIACGGVWHFE